MVLERVCVCERARETRLHLPCVQLANTGTHTNMHSLSSSLSPPPSSSPSPFFFRFFFLSFSAPVLLSFFLPGTAVPGGVQALLGHDVYNRGSWKVHEFCQSEILVKNLVYTILDQLVLKLFPDISEDTLMDFWSAQRSSSSSSSSARASSSGTGSKRPSNGRRSGGGKDSRRSGGRS